MKNTILGFLVSVSVQIAAFHPAGAATMTFNDVNLDPGAHTYSENGILASGNGELGTNSVGSIHFDDGGTSAPSMVRFTTGARFDAVGFDLDPVGFLFHKCNPVTRVCKNKTFNNVLLQGFDGDNLVSSWLFSMGTGKDPHEVLLDETFKNLTAFMISVALPKRPFNYFMDCAAPCSHFQIDNLKLVPAVEIAAVPLPATLPMGAVGLAVLVAAGCRRKKRLTRV